MAYDKRGDLFFTNLALSSNKRTFTSRISMNYLVQCHIFVLPNLFFFMDISGGIKPKEIRILYLATIVLVILTIQFFILDF